MAQDFNLAAFKAIVDGAVWASAHQSFDLHTKLITQTFSRLEHVRTVGVANHLDIAFAVTYVHKNNAAMVSAAVNPTTQGNGLAHEGFGHKTAVVGTHCHSLLFQLPWWAIS
jgi:hypothetical protein